MYLKCRKEMGQKIISANYSRLVKAVTLKLIIDDWMQHNRINDTLLPEQRHDDIEKSIEDLQLPIGWSQNTVPIASTQVAIKGTVQYSTRRASERASRQSAVSD